MDEPLWPQGKAPKDFWKNPDHRRWYLNWLGEQLGYRTPEDWYQITAEDFRTHRGSDLLASYYKNFPVIAVKSLFPKIDWHEWLFADIPDDFWEYPDNRQRYMRWLGEQLGYQNADDWYQLTANDFTRYHGEDLLGTQYKGSSVVAVRDSFPEQTWHAWRFQREAGDTFWEDSELRKNYMCWLGEQLGYRTPDDWYRLTKEDVEAHHGGDLLSDYYQGSRAAALQSYLPDHDWHEWRFADVPGTFWQNPEHRRHYMQWLGEQLGYQAFDDWYKISAQDIETHADRGLLDYYQHALSIAVIDAFPEYKWHLEQFALHQKRQQRLYHIVKQIFTEYDVESNATHAGIRLDVFIPALKLAFECRGEQHQVPPSKLREIPAFKKIRQHDNKKRKIYQKHAITCVEIPCGWDGEMTIEEFSKQFVKHMNACHTWTEHVRAALAAMSAYRQKQRRKRRKKPVAAPQQQLNLLECV